jgi:serine phosphatase RsbU (regulator of sigma subunit)
VALQPGDRLLFYTDGLVETRDRQGCFFELSQQLVADALADPDLDAAIWRLVGLLLEHVGGRLADERPAGPRRARCDPRDTTWRPFPR